MRQTSDGLNLTDSAMKRCALFFVAIVGLLALFILGGRADEKKKIEPAEIYGRIQFVQSFPDYKVKAVTSFPDLSVKIVQSLPRPGEWQIVSSFPDFKIQVVKSFPDFTVEFEDGIPEEAKE